MEQLDMLYDPVFQEEQHNNEVKMTNQIVESISRLDWKNSYLTIISTLWNTGMPCLDQTSLNKENDNSVLKYCEWKGFQVPCAAIFSTFPTDQGICCTFNIKAADELFLGETYPHLIQNIQTTVTNSGLNPLLGKQITEPGQSKGLLVVLDSHSNLYSASSIESETQGFIGIITQGGNFPQRNLGGFDIKPGYKNSLALSAIMISADNELSNINPKSRNCYFEWESSHLKIFKNYTQTNCIFECNLFYAQKVMSKFFQPCLPWYFPSPEMSPNICDPWQAAQVSKIMSNVPINECLHCLSDCNSTIFKTRISTAPIRKCNLNSFKSNYFCNSDNGNILKSEFLSSLLEYSFDQRLSAEPYYYKKNSHSSQRKFGSSLRAGDVFEITNKPYDAFEKDIAIVNIFFEDAYATKFQRSPRFTWTDYFSNVGGSFGLVIGIGIISFIELFWLLVRSLVIIFSKLSFRNTKTNKKVIKN